MTCVQTETISDWNVTVPAQRVQLVVFSCLHCVWRLKFHWLTCTLNMRAIFDLVRPPVVSRTAPTWSEQILMEQKKKGVEGKMSRAHWTLWRISPSHSPSFKPAAAAGTAGRAGFFFLILWNTAPLPLPTGTGRAFFFPGKYTNGSSCNCPRKEVAVCGWGWVGLVAPYHPLVGGICRRSSEGTGSIFGAAFRNRRRRKRAGEREREKGFLVVFTAVRHCQMLTAAF